MQFRLWKAGAKLPSKSKGNLAALEARREILGRVAGALGLEKGVTAGSLDQADAAILVLSAAASRKPGQALVIEHPAEGRFWVTVPPEARVALASR